jgi:uncharacterized spore protein YtfJ
MNNLNEVLSKITEFLKSEAKTETIIGQQFQLGEYTCVPVMSVGIGFGGGSGEGKGNTKNKGEGESIGAAGGAGLGMGPVGFLATKGSDIQFISVRSSKGLDAVIEKVPGLLEKLMTRNKKKEAEKA